MRPRFSDLLLDDPKLATLLSDYEASQEKIRRFTKAFPKQREHEYLNIQSGIREEALKELDAIQYDRHKLEPLVPVPSAASSSAAPAVPSAAPAVPAVPSAAPAAPAVPAAPVVPAAASAPAASAPAASAPAAPAVPAAPAAAPAVPAAPAAPAAAAVSSVNKIVNDNDECCTPDDTDINECCASDTIDDEDCCTVEEDEPQTNAGQQGQQQQPGQQQPGKKQPHKQQPGQKQQPENNDNESRRREAALESQADVLEDIARKVKAKKSGTSQNNSFKTTRQINQLTGKIMDTEEINIAGKIFFIRYDEASRNRRKDIFLNNSVKRKLTDNERHLLEHLSITGSTYDAVKMYLYDFFESLPFCQTTGAILSKRRCEVAHHLLWSVLLKARQDVQRKIDDANQQNLIDSKLLQYQAQIKSLTSRDIAPYMGPKPCDESHDEHMKLESMIKRVGNKVDRIDSRIPAKRPNQKGGALKELQRIYDSLAK